MEKKFGGMVGTGELLFITALASGIIHGLSDEMYVNPIYFYMQGSVDSGFTYTADPDVLAYPFASDKCVKAKWDALGCFRIESLPGC